MVDPNSGIEIVKFGGKLALCLVWGIPWAAVTILFGATIFGLPLAVICAGIAGAPLARVWATYNKRCVQWDNRDIIPEAEEVPWVI